PATIPATTAVTFNPGVRTVMTRDRESLIGQLSESSFPGQHRHRDQTGGRHDIRVIRPGMG
uniref:hypothetical protein n=1 Tax=Mycetocola sp. TaxID=1871042 RepID=UPI0039897794